MADRNLHTNQSGQGLHQKKGPCGSAMSMQVRFTFLAKGLLLVSLGILGGCTVWKEPWNSSQKKLADLCRPFQAKKEAEEFQAKVQKDPFPDASVLNKNTSRPLPIQ